LLLMSSMSGTFRSIIVRLAFAVVLLVTGVPNYVRANPACSAAIAGLPDLTTLSIRDRRESVLETVETNQLEETDYRRADMLADTIAALPEDERELWISNLGIVYRSSEKNHSFANSFRMTIGGRRVIDRVMSLLTSPDKSISRAIENGATPLEAYKSFLSEQNKLYRSDVNPDLVIGVLKLLKAEAKAYSKRSIFSRQPIQILVAGSFANGKAVMAASDIDMNPYGYELEKHLQRAFDGLKANGILSLKPEFHELGPEFYGLRNPCIVIVTPYEALLMVFPPAVTDPANPKELKVVEPTTYTLF
jgi:hypothetical protein